MVLNLMTHGVLGDYNRNRVVDAADDVLWHNVSGQYGAGSLADDNGDYGIGSGDYDVWRVRFGQTPGSGTGARAKAAVPEPARCS
jgi:hypothetical protein